MTLPKLSPFKTIIVRYIKSIVVFIGIAVTVGVFGDVPV